MHDQQPQPLWAKVFAFIVVFLMAMLIVSSLLVAIKWVLGHAN